MFVSHHMGVGNQTRVLCESSKRSNHQAIFTAILGSPREDQMLLVVFEYFVLMQASPVQEASSTFTTSRCSFLSWLTYGTTFACLLYLRIKTKNLPHTYKVTFRIVTFLKARPVLLNLPNAATL